MSNDRPRWGAAADLSRVLPTGTSAPSGPAPAPEPVAPAHEMAPAASVVAPEPPPRPSRDPVRGLRLSLPARIVVGVALVAALGFMVLNAWRNVVG